VRDLVEKCCSTVMGPRHFSSRGVSLGREHRDGMETIRKELDAVMVRRQEIPNSRMCRRTRKLLPKTTTEDIYVLFVRLRQRKQGELRAMPGHGAALASHSGDDDGLFLDSSAPYAHTSAPRALQRRAALSPWIESSRAGRQLQNSSWKRHRLLERKQSLISTTATSTKSGTTAISDRVVLFVDFVRATIFPLSIVNRSHYLGAWPLCILEIRINNKKLIFLIELVKGTQIIPVASACGRCANKVHQFGIHDLQRLFSACELKSAARAISVPM